MKAFISALEDHALALGLFETVNGHESPRNAPGNGVSYDLWWQGTIPAPFASGLNVTAVVLHIQGRVYVSADQLPYDDIDPAVADAATGLIAAYSAAFTLGGLVRNVDLEGESGVQLKAEGGWVERDNRKLRVATLEIPLIVNDLFAQVA